MQGFGNSAMAEFILIAGMIDNVSIGIMYTKNVAEPVFGVCTNREILLIVAYFFIAVNMPTQGNCYVCSFNISRCFILE